MRDSPHFVALRHRNFRLLWLGQLVSFTGSMMQSAAILWHVALLAPPDQKGLALGAVGLARFLPLLGFSLVSGVVADALDRRRIIVVTNTVMALSAVALAWATFHGLHALWPIYVLTAIGFVAGSFDAPARQSLTPALVPRESLPNAIALNMVMFQGAAVAGPALAGLFIATLDIGWVYAFNAISFGAVVIAVLAMSDLPERPFAERARLHLSSAMEGLRFVFRAPLLRSTMLLDFFATFFASAMALLPLFAQDVLKVGADGYGALAAAPAVGAGITSVFMVRQTERIDRRGRVLLMAVAGYGIATILFGLSRSFWLTALCLALIGATDMVSTVLRNLIRQLETPDHLRGRMTSVNMLFFMGGPQLGELEAGAVANLVSAPFSVVSGGVACLLTCGWVAWRTPSLRRYRKGEHDAVASG